MADSGNATLLEVYRQINSKLKKRRFFAKPNFTEAIDGYTELMKALKHAEEDEFSGQVSIAIAKCQQQSQNNLLEALYYHRGGRFLMTAQKQLSLTQSPTFHELAEMGLECFQIAINLYLDMKRFAMAASLYYELAEHLFLLKRPKEASKFYERAAELQQTDNAMSAIVSLQKAFQCDVRLTQYDSADEKLQWIIKLATEQSTLNNDTFYVDIQIEATVSFILLLILQGDFAEAKLRTTILQRSHGESPEQTANPDSKNVNIFFTSEWFFVLMECLIDAVESANEREAIKIQSEMQQLLTPMQNEILIPILQASKVNFV